MMTLIDRFESKLLMCPMSGCWLWTGALMNGRYGQFSIGHQRWFLAHRIAWEIHKGRIPDGLEVLHTCDVPSCVNPAHLFLGTQLDNIADATRKRRVKRGDDHWTREKPERVARGEAQRHKLTERDVRQIRAMVADGAPIKTVAARFGVCFQTVSSVSNRRTWAHVIA